ncbi:WXG100 family type VII secretion target, partial [Micromonospora sp. URMC 106]|uniref:WXG100 family type VII secretion target n=1 Tax=Micromonospora sp. URMC 106 TaxID=3423408 RepID=UPI003F1C7230
MSDNYYGWTPTYIPSYAGVVDDYAAERSAQAEPYEPTNWDGVTIEQMWEYARKESDERTVALAETWRRASSLLQTTRENLKRHADALDAKWRSPAGRVFMGKVGAALYSLDEWKDVADKTASGLEQLAGKIAQTQRDMRELWLEYKAEQEHQADKRKDDEGVQVSDLFGINNAKSYDEVQKEFHERAKNIVKPLADLYIDVYISNISRGGMYKGPTNAVVHTPSLAPRPTRPGAPAGPKPVAPTMSGDRPNRPDMPNRPDTPTTPTPPPPGLPNDLTLAGTVTAPPAPTGPPPAAPPVTPTPTT